MNNSTFNFFWRLHGWWRYLRGRRDWGTRSRVGFKPTA